MDSDRVQIDTAADGTPTAIVRRSALPLLPKPETPLTECPTNLDLSTDVGKALLIAASSPPTMKVKKTGSVSIMAVGYLITGDEAADESTGELRQFTRVTFVDAQGDTVATTSPHAPAKALALLALFSPERWRDGIPIIICERKSDRGTTYHDIKLDVSLLR